MTRTPGPASTIDVASILPHRPPMLLVHEVVELRPDGVRCAGGITGDSPFAAGGVVTSLLALEVAAQSAALCAAHLGARDGGPPAPQQGYLATLREVRLQMPTVPVDVRLLADVRPTRSLGGLALYEARVCFEDGREVLQGGFSVTTSIPA